jgi:hypothetical protein
MLALKLTFIILRETTAKLQKFSMSKTSHRKKKQDRKKSPAQIKHNRLHSTSSPQQAGTVTGSIHTVMGKETMPPPAK